MKLCLFCSLEKNPSKATLVSLKKEIFHEIASWNQVIEVKFPA